MYIAVLGILTTVPIIVSFLPISMYTYNNKGCQPAAVIAVTI